MNKAYTPGPWRWEFNDKSKDIRVVGGKTKYDLTVMDFIRYGMGGAAPRFNIDHGQDMQLMRRADEMGQIVPGREHHANWFQNISHPDASLIAAAPELLEALQNCLSALYSFTNSDKSTPDSEKWIEILEAEKAINKALGL